MNCRKFLLFLHCASSRINFFWGILHATAEKKHSNLQCLAGTLEKFFRITLLEDYQQWTVTMEMRLKGSGICLAIHFLWSAEVVPGSFCSWSPSHSFSLVLWLHLVEKEIRTKASSVLRAMSLQFSLSFFFVPTRCTSETWKLSVGEKKFTQLSQHQKKVRLTSFFFKQEQNLPLSTRVTTR